MYSHASGFSYQMHSLRMPFN